MDPSEERSRLVYTGDFLREARHLGLIDSEAYARLREALGARWNALVIEGQQAADVRERIPETAPSAVRTGGAVALLPPPPTMPLSPQAPPAAAGAPAPMPTPPEPSPRPASRSGLSRPKWVRRGRRLRALVASDLGIHGLAYLGVLLLFAGTFGLVFFSLQDVRRDLRPVAEAAIPTTFFLSAWFLSRRGAPLVSWGIELVGGALFPVVLLASFADRAGVPPDVSGPPLAVVLGGTSIAVAVSYWWWSGRHPASALRYLVGPAAWLAVAALAFLFKSNEPVTGLAIERPVPIQVGLAAAAVALTLQAIRLRPNHPLASPTRVAAIPGIVAAYLLTILLASTHGWAPAPLVVAGLAAIVAIDSLADSLGRSVRAPALQSVVVAVTVSALGARWGTATGGTAAVIASISLLEWQTRRGAAPAARLLPLLGIASGLGMSLAAPLAALSAWSVASAWVHLRRQLPAPSDVPTEWLTEAAALLPVGAGYGVLRVLPDGEAWLAMAATLVAVASVARRWLRDDVFWAWWPSVAAVAVAAGVWFTRVTNPALSRWQLGAATGLAVAALVLPPTWRSVPAWSAARVWAAAAVAALALSIGFDAAGLAAGLRPLAWGAAGLGAVVSAVLWRRHPAGHLSVIGLVATSGALIAPASDVVRLGALATWAGAWLTIVAAHEAIPDGDPLMAMLFRWADRVGGRLGRSLKGAARTLPSAALVASVPFLVVRAASLWDAFDRHRSWSGVALAATALLYSAVARVLSARRPLATVLASGSVVVGGIAIAVTAPSSWPTIESVAASIAVVWLMGGQVRRPFMTVFAWTMSGLLAVLVAAQFGVPSASINLVSLGWGAALLVGGLALDEMLGGRRRPGEGIRVKWLAPPVAIGAIAVPASLGPVFTYHATAFGWWMAGAAVLYLVVAVQLRAGAISAAAYGLASAAVIALLPWSPMQRPSIFAPWAALLVAVSWAASAPASRRPGQRDPWTRWDLAPLLVAHAVAGLALVRSVDIGAIPVTWAAFGGLSFANFALRRNWPWAAGGFALILVASGAAGPAWLAVTLGAITAASIAAAIRTSGGVRTILQALGVVSAAWGWGETILAAGWPANQAVGASSLAFGGLALLIGMLAWRGHLGRDWAGWWGGLAAVGTVVTAGATVSPDGLRYIDDLLPAAGMALFAGGAALASAPLEWTGLRWVTVAAAGLAWGESAAGLGWSGSEAVTATSLAAGGIAVVAGGSLRLRGTDPQWPLAWGALSSVGLLAAARIGVVGQSASTDPFPNVVGSLPAVGAALFAAGLGLAAHRFPRAGLQFLAAAVVGWVWTELVLGLNWPPEVWVPVSAVASGGLALISNSALRFRQLSRVWTLSWSGLAALGLAVAWAAVPAVERRPGGLSAAGGLALFAAASAVGARPLEIARLRETASVLALASGAMVLYGLHPSSETQVAATAAAGFAAMVGSLILWRRNPNSHWLPPLAVFGAASSAASIPIAAIAWPRRGLLVAALVVTGSEAAAAGFTLRRSLPLYFSPVLLCAAWLVYASEALTGNPQPFTVPIGLGLLVLVELARSDRRRAGKHPVTPVLLILEFSGLGFLVGAALVQIVTAHLLYGLLAVALAGAVIGWGGLTRVRRRCAFGALVAFVAVVLMLGAPIAHNIPQFRGAALWVTVAAVGAVLIVVAGLLEQGRDKVKRTVRRVGELMEGWE